MTAEKIGDAVESIMGYRPKFAPCLSCGVPTTGGADCFDCSEKRARIDQAIRSYHGTIPEGFRWALQGVVNSGSSDLLRARVARLDRVSILAASQSRKLVLVGKSGAGKTSLAIALGRIWVRDNAKAARFCMAQDLASARRRSPLGKEAPEVVEAMTARMLILDDLGTEPHEKDSAVVDTVFRRSAEDRPTWVTTWLAPEAMAERYGEGFTRRVYERARVVEL